MKSCPEEAWEILCDVLAACLGLAQTRDGHTLPPGGESTSVACLMQLFNSSENRTMSEFLESWHGVITWPSMVW